MPKYLTAYERLARAYNKLLLENAALIAEREHTERKIMHHCTDAYCPECDGPRKRTKKKTGG
jgi:hypothetical protein